MGPQRGNKSINANEPIVRQKEKKNNDQNKRYDKKHYKTVTINREWDAVEGKEKQ